MEFTQMKRNWNLTDYYCPGVYLSPDIAVYTQLAEWMHVFIMNARVQCIRRKN